MSQQTLPSCLGRCTLAVIESSFPEEEEKKRILHTATTISRRKLTAQNKFASQTHKYFPVLECNFSYYGLLIICTPGPEVTVYHEL